MKVIICGAGQVGWQIARHLSSEKNDVMIVDSNPALVRQATDTLNVQGLTGFASYPGILARAGAGDADMIVAATRSDEVNMVTCQIAHSVFTVPRKIARLRAQPYLEAVDSGLYRRDHLPIDVVISPEREVAQTALRRLAAPTAFDTESFMDDECQLLGIRLEADCSVLNTPLRQLTDIFATLACVVAGVRRDGALFTPDSGDQLFAHDEIYVFTRTEDVSRTMEVFGKVPEMRDRVVIIGAGNVGRGVAEALEARPRRVRAKIIERNRVCAETAADSLERTIVLHGDGMDRELLLEANIESSEAVLAVTDDDKTNILACVRAKSAGCPTAICLINDPTLASLMGPLDIDAYINPRATTVSSILRHIRHGRVRNVYSIGDAEAEIIEAKVLSTSPIEGKALRDIDFPEGVLLGAIRKGDRIVRPEGETRIEEGDTIIVFSLAADVPSVERLLRVSVEYF